MTGEVWVHFFKNFAFIQFVGILCITFSEELILSRNVLTNLVKQLMLLGNLKI